MREWVIFFMSGADAAGRLLGWRDSPYSRSPESELLDEKLELLESESEELELEADILGFPAPLVFESITINLR